LLLIRIGFCDIPYKDCVSFYKVTRIIYCGPSMEELARPISRTTCTSERKWTFCENSQASCGRTCLSSISPKCSFRILRIFLHLPYSYLMATYQTFFLFYDLHTNIITELREKNSRIDKEIRKNRKVLVQSSARETKFAIFLSSNLSRYKIIDLLIIILALHSIVSTINQCVSNFNRRSATIRL